MANHFALLAQCPAPRRATMFDLSDRWAVALSMSTSGSCDLSLAAAFRRRGIPACNGQDDDPHATGGCEVGSLHTRACELAIALAAMLEGRGGAARATAAIEQLDAELGRVLGDRPRVE